MVAWCMQNDSMRGEKQDERRRCERKKLSADSWHSWHTRHVHGPHSWHEQHVVCKFMAFMAYMSRSWTAFMACKKVVCRFMALTAIHLIFMDHVHGMHVLFMIERGWPGWKQRQSHPLQHFQLSLSCLIDCHVMSLSLHSRTDRLSCHVIVITQHLLSDRLSCQVH